MTVGSFARRLRGLVPVGRRCHQCGKRIDTRRQMWSQGHVFCSTTCTEAWHGKKLYFD